MNDKKTVEYSESILEKVKTVNKNVEPMNYLELKRFFMKLMKKFWERRRVLIKGFKTDMDKDNHFDGTSIHYYIKLFFFKSCNWCLRTLQIELKTTCKNF